MEDRIVRYSRGEENLNIMTHLVGFILTLVFFIPQITKKYNIGDNLGFLAWILYFISIAGMFLSSTLYHSIKKDYLRIIFRAIDHGVIYLAIAGSYSPIVLIGLQSRKSILFFIMIWILALGGIIMNILAFSHKKEDKISKPSMIIYIIMGWLSLAILYDLYKKIGIGYIIYLLIGGLFYTVGAYFYKNKKIKFNHAIWHGFILVAAFTMFIGNIVYLT